MDDNAEAASVLDVSGFVRRVRRLADLSQRELAEAVGLPQSTIARIENGRAVDAVAFATILAAAGLRLAVVDATGTEVPPMASEVYRDSAGRRQPAHLDVHVATGAPPDYRLLLRYSTGRRSPNPAHYRRLHRDRLRAAAGSLPGHAPPEQATPAATAAAARDALERRRAAVRVRVTSGRDGYD